MKRTQLILLLVAAVVILIVTSGTFYIVSETEQAIITQFGKPVGGAITEPGLHIKTPFIQRAIFFEDRWLEWDGERNQVPTRDKKYIWVDVYARWRVDDPLKYYQTVFNEAGAQTRLDDIIDGETRNAIAQHKLIEIVRSSNRKLSVDEESLAMVDSAALVDIEVGREKIVNLILEKASVNAQDYGIKIVDVRIKRINYSERVREKVYDRMISERQRIAERYRSEGQAKNEEIMGRKEKELKRISSEAYKEAQQVKGKADARAARIYAQAYQKDADFYSFVKTLDGYKSTLDEKSWVILSTESDFYKYLKEAR